MQTVPVTGPGADTPAPAVPRSRHSPTPALGREHLLVPGASGPRRTRDSHEPAWLPLHLAKLMVVRCVVAEVSDRCMSRSVSSVVGREGPQPPQKGLWP